MPAGGAGTPCRPAARGHLFYTFYIFFTKRILPILHADTSINVLKQVCCAAMLKRVRRCPPVAVWALAGVQSKSGAAAKGTTNGYFWCAYAGGRPCAVFIWNGNHEFGAEQSQRRAAGTNFGKAYLQQMEGRAAGRAGDGRHPVFLGHHGDGGGVCKLRHHAAVAGRGRHHGRQHRHHGHVVDPQPCQPGG